MRLLLALALLGTACGGSERPPQAAEARHAADLPPSAAVRAWMRAVLAADRKAFVAAYSARLRERLERESLVEVLEAYRQGWVDQLGELSADDLDLSFEGDHATGRVRVAWRARSLPAIRVVREADGWKIDER